MLVVEKIISTRKVQKALSDGSKRTEGKFSLLLLEVLGFWVARLPAEGPLLLIFHVLAFGMIG
jgi:hypothetical protein